MTLTSCPDDEIYGPCSRVHHSDPECGGVVSAALFDLDGTLLETPRLIIAEMADEAYEVTGLRAEPEIVWRLVGMPLEEIALVLARGDAALAQLIASGYRRRYLERIVPAGARLLFVGVADGLNALRRHGWQIGVVTNKSHRGAEEILRSAGLDTYLDVLIGVDDAPRPKPHPSPVLAAIETLRVPAAHVVMIGDTVHDITAGNAAGVRTIGVTYGVGTRSDLVAAGADAIADDFIQVVDMLAGHARPSPVPRLAAQGNSTVEDQSA